MFVYGFYGLFFRENPGRIKISENFSKSHIFDFFDVWSSQGIF